MEKRRRILYLVWDARVPFDGALLSELLSAGVDWVQVRTKDPREARRWGEGFKEVLSDFRGKRLFINDFPEVAAFVEADGVHLGKEDPSISTVRTEYPGLLVGFSCDNRSEIAEAVKLGADYVSLGPVFPTSTKTDLPPPLGVSGIESEVLHEEKLILIGGINLHNLPLLLPFNVLGVAVFSAILLAEDPPSAAEKFRGLLGQ
jgi:thiamine-phosphate pyrophosphorylase